jgi:zona occludens toxin (predicted ATPase)
MDLTNLSQAEKALLAFCGVFVVIFSSVMYYLMIIQPNQAAPSQEAPRAAYSEAQPTGIAADTLAPAASQGANDGVSRSR